MKKVHNKTYAIILLLILVALGGIILYGKKLEGMPTTPPTNTHGPSVPPPGYEATR